MKSDSGGYKGDYMELMKVSDYLLKERKFTVAEAFWVKNIGRYLMNIDNVHKCVWSHTHLLMSQVAVEMSIAVSWAIYMEAMEETMEETD